MLYTSYFAKSAKHPGAVSIAVGTPKFFSGPRCQKLMPPWPLVAAIKDGSITQEEYVTAYKHAVLDHLDPHEVAKELTERGEDTVLLCWEKAGDFCHRQLIAQWLFEAGYEVREL